jgi:hypothetical protein
MKMRWDAAPFLLAAESARAIIDRDARQSSAKL